MSTSRSVPYSLSTPQWSGRGVAPWSWRVLRSRAALDAAGMLRAEGSLTARLLLIMQASRNKSKKFHSDTLAAGHACPGGASGSRWGAID